RTDLSDDRQKNLCETSELESDSLIPRSTPTSIFNQRENGVPLPACLRQDFRRLQTRPAKGVAFVFIENRYWEVDVSRRATYRSFQFASFACAPVAGPTHDSVKEVIQPQVPLRLPCYDFAPVTALAFGRLPPCGLRHGLRALTAPMA